MTRDRRFFDGTEQLSQSELRGLLLFSSAFGERPSPIRNPTSRVPLKLADGRTDADLRCTACHGGPEMTAASIDAVTEDARVERMAQLPANGQPRCGIYDAGHFHTGVRRVNDDPALGGLDPFGNSFGETAIIIRAAFNGGPLLTSLVPTAVSPFGLAPGINGTTNCGNGADNVNGTFKAPSLRNVELTGPYFQTVASCHCGRSSISTTAAATSRQSRVRSERPQPEPRRPGQERPGVVPARADRSARGVRTGAIRPSRHLCG